MILACLPGRIHQKKIRKDESRTREMVKGAPDPTDDRSDNGHDPVVGRRGEQVTDLRVRGTGCSLGAASAVPFCLSGAGLIRGNEAPESRGGSTRPPGRGQARTADNRRISPAGRKADAREARLAGGKKDELVS